MDEQIQPAAVALGGVWRIVLRPVR